MAEFRADFPSDTASVGRARTSLVRFASTAGIYGDALRDFEIAVGEALCNAAEHGHCEGARFRVVAEVADGTMTVDITDGGPGFATWNDATHPRRTVATRGFGISIMRTLMDRVEFRDGGRHVRLVKRLAIDAFGADGAASGVRPQG